MRSWLLAVLLGLGCVAHATLEVHDFSSTEQEARYKSLIHELRCLVCQNQNLADSNADLAKDLRQQTYDMIIQGASDQEIVDYMVARYGDFVLYRPPFRLSTALLWVGPFIILLAGVMILMVVIRRRKRQPAAELTEAERERARHLLDESDS